MDDTESHEILVDFGKICRLCLTCDGVLISLFSSDSVSENGNVKSVPDKIMDLMSIAVSKNDGFPPWICHNCLSQVDKCLEFFDQCRTNQTALKESYMAALSEAEVNVLSMKVGYETNENSLLKQDERLVTVYNSYQVNVKKKDLGDSGTENDERGESNVREEVMVLEEEQESSVSQHYCLECSKDFTSPDEYFVHRLIAHRDEEIIPRSNATDEVGDQESSDVYECDICGAKFQNKNARTNHIRFRHGKVERETVSCDLEKLAFCKYCGLSFSRKNMSRHLEVVHRMTKNTETDQRDVGSFDCRICYRPFLRQSSLRSHIEKVHGDNLEVMAEVENCEIVWNCSECDSVFLEEVNLVQHYGSKHSKYPLEVDALRGLKSKSLICTCGVISSNAFDSSLHLIFRHSEVKLEAGEAIECPGCESTFPDVEELKIHLVSFHWFSSISYDNECVFCGHSFKTNDLLRLHLNDVHQITFEKNLFEENRWNKRKKDDGMMENDARGDDGESKESSGCFSVCENCGESQKTEKDAQNHARICPFSHKCKLCGKGYKTSNHLKRHVTEFHNTLAPIKCPLCSKIFPRKMNLHHHYKRRHLKQTKKYVCSYCGQSLKGIVALRSHEDRLHRNVRNYKCPECPEAFTTRGILHKHAQRHLSERPMLQCQFCEKKFSTISGIERHIKTHEGVKEFQCETPLCGKSFYTKSELKRHIKFHTRDFKHVCPVCNHKFMSPGELKKHSTKHTGERPFKCHLCPCAYARRDDKVKHLKRVHNLKVKRVYGKSLIRSSDQDDTHLIDTIVIDDGSNPEGNSHGNEADAGKTASAVQ